MIRKRQKEAVPFGERLLSLFYPNRCLLCRKPMAKNGGLCENCKKEKPVSPLERRLEAYIPGGRNFLCRSPFLYTEGIRLSIHMFKFRGKYSLSKGFAREMVSCVPQKPWDAVTWVPMTGKERKKRGYNQSQLLAKELSALLEIPAENLLEKVKDTTPQHQLSGKERRNHTRSLYRGISDVKGKRVLLIDDVVTTGATLCACSGELFRKGAAEVTAICCADARQKGRTEEKE
jgi:competence protein ComFC